MPVESIPIYGLLRSFLRWLPSWLLRRYYSADRLAQLIYFDFQPRCESAWVNVAGAASVRLTMQLINLSPFPVELDRAQLRFVYAGATVNFSSLGRQTVGPGDSLSLFLEEALADGHAAAIRANWQGNQAWLDGLLEFNCRVRQFAKHLSSMTGIQVSVVNAHLPTKAA